MNKKEIRILISYKKNFPNVLQARQIERFWTICKREHSKQRLNQF